MKTYDAIIGGASFAGLSIASRLKGKVLLIDKHDIGTYQISACGAPYSSIKGTGCEDSVLQISDTFSLHVNSKKIDFHLKKPYCTFDFAKFCKILNSKNRADFFKANIIYIEKNGLFTVYTSKGSFSSRILVDATGWHAAIAEKLKLGYVHQDMLSYGIETEVPYQCREFHFFYEPDFLEEGVSWIFPCGEFSRFGVASYTGARKLINKLDSFLERYDLKSQKIHGGFFCYCFKEPVVEDVFVLGCSQGLTLPLTGEGIRRCITYGMKCGDIIQKILDEKISLKEGLNEYSGFALKGKKDYDFFLKAQNRFLEMSERKIEVLSKIISNRLVFNLLERRYSRV